MSTEQQQQHGSTETAGSDRFENPGLPPHRHRVGDDDPKAAKKSERIIVVIFIVSVLASIGGVVGYFLFPVDASADLGFHEVRMSTLTIGVGLGLGMLGIGVAAVQWARSLMDDTERIEDRHPMSEGPSTQRQALEMLQDGVRESNIARRPLLLGALGGAVALAPLPFVVPMIGNLGADWNISNFKHTAWAPIQGETPVAKIANAEGDAESGAGDGPQANPEAESTRPGEPQSFYYRDQYRYLASDPQDRPIRAADVTNGSIVHVIPHGMSHHYESSPEGTHILDEKAKAVVLLIRVNPDLLTPATAEWAYDGIVAYSKICTHVGCPVALYEQQTHHVLCPCHQSTFDVLDQAKVVFGPATRPLPQLPIAVDEAGYLYAAADFDEAVGPSYWQRES